jgi:hypothetical protein
LGAWAWAESFFQLFFSPKKGFFSDFFVKRRSPSSSVGSI